MEKAVYFEIEWPASLGCRGFVETQQTERLVVAFEGKREEPEKPKP